MNIKTDNLIKVSEFAKQYPRSKGGIGVSPAYIYKLLKTKPAGTLGFKLTIIADVHFIETLGN